MAKLAIAVALALFAACAAAEVCPTYKIVEGDTLAKIATATGNTAEAVEAAWTSACPDLVSKNADGSWNLQPGITVCLPGYTAVCKTVTGEPGCKFYTTVSGDTLQTVGTKFGVQLAEMQAWNPDAPAPLQPNYVLRLQAKTATCDKPALPECCVVRVKDGQSLANIAEENGITLAQIQSVNKGLDPAKLQPNDVVKLYPFPDSCPAAGKTCGGGEPVTPGGCKTHTVASGESASSIATKYGITLAKLAEFNPTVTDLAQLSIGDVLTVSDCTPAAPPAPVPAPPAPSAGNDTAPATPPPAPVSGARAAAAGGLLAAVVALAL